jgi:hypothetical protein
MPLFHIHLITYSISFGLSKITSNKLDGLLKTPPGGSLFSDTELYADQKSSGCLFSILMYTLKYTLKVHYFLSRVLQKLEIKQ